MSSARRLRHLTALLCWFSLVAATRFAAAGEHWDVAELIRGLKSENPKVRYRAARSLKSLRAKASPAIEALIAALKDDGAPVDDRLQYPGPFVRDAASDALVRIGQPAVPSLIRALHEEDASTCVMAAQALGKIGRQASSSFPALKVLLDDPRDWVRVKTVEAISRVGAEPRLVAPLLMRTFRQTPALRTHVLRALHDADPDGTLAIPILVESLRDPDGSVMAAATMTLAKFGARARSASAALTSMLSSTKQYVVMPFDFGVEVPVRTTAARALAEIGPAAATAVPALSRMMRDDPDRAARLWAAAALVRITGKDSQSEPTLSLLVDAMHHGDSRLREEAAAALGVTRCNAATAVLIEVLSSPNVPETAEIRDDAARALGGMGGEARPAVPALRAALLGEDFELQCEAALALGKIGKAALRAVPDLTTAGDTENQRLRDAAEDAIDRIRSAALRDAAQK